MCCRCKIKDRIKTSSIRYLWESIIWIGWKKNWLRWDWACWLFPHYRHNKNRMWSLSWPMTWAMATWVASDRRNSGPPTSTGWHWTEHVLPVPMPVQRWVHPHGQAWWPVYTPDIHPSAETRRYSRKDSFHCPPAPTRFSICLRMPDIPPVLSVNGALVSPVPPVIRWIRAWTISSATTASLWHITTIRTTCGVTRQWSGFPKTTTVGSAPILRTLFRKKRSGSSKNRKRIHSSSSCPSCFPMPNWWLPRIPLFSSCVGRLRRFRIKEPIQALLSEREGICPRSTRVPHMQPWWNESISTWDRSLINWRRRDCMIIPWLSSRVTTVPTVRGVATRTFSTVTASIADTNAIFMREASVFQPSSPGKGRWQVVRRVTLPSPFGITCPPLPNCSTGSLRKKPME